LSCFKKLLEVYRLNPLKRVNSILTQVKSQLALERATEVSIPSNGSIQFLPEVALAEAKATVAKSQSPQTGQFNSY